MHLRSGFQAADDELENIRFLYNYKSEHDVVPGTNNVGTNYDGYDTFYGLGLGINTDNLTLSAEYLKHDMYYDAETISASLKYNF
tara:strand:- start:141 stop:395 length:255 start_codon:yes stop_codon:yes gene_type:complete